MLERTPEKQGGSSFSHAIRGLSFPAAFLAVVFLLTACGPMVRPYYNRDVGGYLMPDPSLTPTALVPVELKGAEDIDRLRKIADGYLGVSYSFGGQSRSGMDCSGFIRQVFSEAHGLRLPHSSRAMFGMGRPVPRGELKPGDVVFFKVMGFVDHAGIYMGRNYFIHASTSVGVAYSTLTAPYFGNHYAGARRMLDAP